jgi:hypothetical protein
MASISTLCKEVNQKQETEANLHPIEIYKYVPLETAITCHFSFVGVLWQSKHYLLLQFWNKVIKAIHISTIDENKIKTSCS